MHKYILSFSNFILRVSLSFPSLEKKFPSSSSFFISARSRDYQKSARDSALLSFSCVEQCDTAIKVLQRRKLERDARQLSPRENESWNVFVNGPRQNRGNDRNRHRIRNDKFESISEKEPFKKSDSIQDRYFFSSFFPN